MAQALRERLNVPVLLIAANSVLMARFPTDWVHTGSWRTSELVGVMLEVQLFAVAAALVLWRHWKVALAVLLLSPVHFRFWEGAYRYARGKAYYLTWGSFRDH